MWHERLIDLGRSVRAGALLAVAFWTPLAMAESPSPAQTESSDLYRRASEAYRSSDFETAAELYTQILESEALSPEGRIEVLLLSAKCHVVLGDALHLKESLRSILNLDPLFRLDLDRHRSLADAYFEVFGASVAREPGVHTIGVLDFDVAIVGKDKQDGDDLGIALGHMISSSLAPATKLDVVERLRLKHVLGEIGLSESGAVSQETLVHAGRLAGAQSLLVGALVGVGNRFELHARIIFTEEGTQVAEEVVSFEGSLDKVFDAVRELSKKTAQRLDTELNAVGALGWSLDAERLYAKALWSYDVGDYHQAMVHCRTALEFDPRHDDAQVMLEELSILAGGAALAD